MDNSTEPKLKACPFCGSKKKIEIGEDDMFYVECLKCGARTDFYLFDVDAIAAWNTRQADTDLVDAKEQRLIIEDLVMFLRRIFAGQKIQQIIEDYLERKGLKSSLPMQASTALPTYHKQLPIDESFSQSDTDLVDALEKRLDAVDKLSVCYRLSKPASCKLLDDLDRTRKNLAKIKKGK